MTENSGATPGAGPLGVLARLQRPRPTPRPGEQCEMCGADIPDEHSHVVRLDDRALLCACRACYLLFTHHGAAGGRYRAVPDRCLALPEFRLTRADWESLQIPVEVAFFFFNSALDRIAAFYPSPAGATESLLPLDAWDALVEANPILATLEPDVEALLVRAVKGADPDCYVVPVDVCYELVGTMRLVWRGFDGGSEARAAVEGFFDNVRKRAKVVLG